MLQLNAFFIFKYSQLVIILQQNKNSLLNTNRYYRTINVNVHIIKLLVDEYYKKCIVLNNTLYPNLILKLLEYF